MTLQTIIMITCDNKKCTDHFFCPLETSHPHIDAVNKAAKEGWIRSGHTNNNYCSEECYSSDLESK